MRPWLELELRLIEIRETMEEMSKVHGKAEYLRNIEARLFMMRCHLGNTEQDLVNLFLKASEKELLTLNDRIVGA